MRGGRTYRVCCFGCELSAVSQGILTSSPAYTYCSGETRTTVDYVFMDVETASMITVYVTHDMEDLNTSNHLPITVSLVYSPKSIQDFKHCENVSTFMTG